MTRVAVGMQKGGVGKTTTSINVAGALAERGHDVLAVDADPQGGMTLKLGHRERYREHDDTLFDVLADVGELNYGDLGELVLVDDEFDLIPASLKNFVLEKHLHTDRRGTESLALALDESGLDDAYDYIVIDTPPNLGPLADGGILAAENVLFPTRVNVIARDSLEILFDEIDTLEAEFECSVTTAGTVLNEVPAQGNIAAELEAWFVETFGEEFVFEIPDRDAVEHAIEYRTSVFAYDPDDAGYPWDSDPIADLRDQYDQIAAHLEETL
jgi:chromosome partitioning protein